MWGTKWRISSLLQHVLETPIRKRLGMNGALTSACGAVHYAVILQVYNFIGICGMIL